MASPRLFYRYKLHHVLFWTLLFGAWYFFRYDGYSTAARALWVTAIKVVDLALMVYVTNYLLIPRLLYKKKYALFGLLFFAMITSSSLFKMHVIFNVVLGSSGTFLSLFDNNLKARIYDNVIPHFLLVSTGAAFKLVLDYARAQRRMGEMAAAAAEAELNFLKSQINPHFLFNALNTVYFLIDKKNTEARHALHTFSDLLRYQLYEGKGEKIPIEKEVGYLRDYIAVQRLRQDDHCRVNVNVEPNVAGFSIEPLLLVPLVENSFKHLSHRSDGQKNEICIDLSRQNGEMLFRIKNTTENEPVTELKKEGGIGLANVKRRLELLYPQRHSLTVNRPAGWFDVQLKIKVGPAHEATH